MKITFSNRLALVNGRSDLPALVRRQSDHPEICGRRILQAFRRPSLPLGTLYPLPGCGSALAAGIFALLGTNRRARWTKAVSCPIPKSFLGHEIVFGGAEAVPLALDKRKMIRLRGRLPYSLWLFPTPVPNPVESAHSAKSMCRTRSRSRDRNADLRPGRSIKRNRLQAEGS